MDFSINFLDHVAIRVKDLDQSAKWYEKALGLKRYQFAEWGPYPIFMLAGQTGIALFPADTADPKLDLTSRNVKIDHFAFNVSQSDFKKAQSHYKDIDVPFTFQDHQFYHSIYTKDPDGHTVELTTLVVAPEELEKKNKAP